MSLHERSAGEVWLSTVKKVGDFVGHQDQAERPCPVASYLHSSCDSSRVLLNLWFFKGLEGQMALVLS
jgi:hypothetical protein